MVILMFMSFASPLVSQAQSVSTHESPAPARMYYLLREEDENPFAWPGPRENSSPRLSYSCQNSSSVAINPDGDFSRPATERNATVQPSKEGIRPQGQNPP
jgi:hypothetical protein